MKIVDRVCYLLTHNQELRNSDKKLLLAYWDMQGLGLSETQQVKFLKCTPAESITRARRQLSYKFPAKKEVAEERALKAERYKHVMSPRAVSWLNDDEQE